ncbi:PTS lactose transporter subunit IIA [Dolosicoccus paucivorans]|uniref:lactose-specific PTS transporter subunit IIA n=1 Tax=Dolosicoccus paucivorans TaxID=84521 RepID=UPI000C80BBB0|nr:lactose-specific PTS transporter subunit IIA [Dolosicoccus paucivorans]PMB85165.1 PTS lactose transporter subunit IIA [Dolosicoccus paucivorans]
MNKEEVTMIGFEIVAYAGEARSKLLDALREAQNGNYSRAEELVEEANTSLVAAHKSQTNMLAKEAQGENIELGFIMVHGQDHLMTTILLKDIINHLIEMYRRGA